MLSSHTNPTGTALHGVFIALILLRGLDGTEGGTGRVRKTGDGVLDNMRCGSLFVCWTRIDSGIALLRPPGLVTSHLTESLALWAGREEDAVFRVYPPVEIPTEF